MQCECVHFVGEGEINLPEQIKQGLAGINPQFKPKSAGLSVVTGLMTCNTP